ncbi:MAG: ribonuclease III [Bacilli bacterium]|nr:ribonuclease III [Bacilli bacterium]
MMHTKDKNVLTLAYIGDAIYEVYVRKFFIDNGLTKVDSLQKKAVEYVSAKAQAKFLTTLMDNKFFNDIELEVIFRARNHKSRMPKNTDIITYKYATSLEAVVGYLYLDNQSARLDELMEKILND